MPTTGGNISMKSSIPPADAFTVQRMGRVERPLYPRAATQYSASSTLDFGNWPIDGTSRGAELSRRDWICEVCQLLVGRGVGVDRD
jgi:hypothetical protein